MSEDAETSVAQIEETTGRITLLSCSKNATPIHGVYQLSGSQFCIVYDGVVTKCDIWDCNNSRQALRTTQIGESRSIEIFFAEGGLFFTLWNKNHAGKYEVDVTDGSSPSPSTLLSITFPSSLILYHFSMAL
ncbi:hypothetical protein Pelo_18004 [Pelomyxa schiedti]|nr:hypothetical protein Pelo_18004 [Pelomyxa schiedti]